jgi:radical SAM protein with 4Fe4S-binding SPASM domain
VCVDSAYRLVEKVALRKERKPFDVLIELTHRCNLKCEHCFLKGAHTNELSTEDFISIFQKLKDWGILFIGFSGGEIFTRGDFLYLAEKARDMGLFFHLQTNGTLITSKIAEVIKALNPTKVEISIYGSTAATHDSVTGIKGSFERSLNALKVLREIGVRMVIKTSVMRKNLGEIDSIRKIAKELGAGFSPDPLIAPRIDGKIPLSCRLSDWEMAQFILTLPFKEEVEGVSLEGQLICGAGRSRFAIGPDGTVYPCALFRFPLGNLKNENLSAIWRGQPWKKIRSIKVNDLRVCPDCSLVWNCARCPGLAYLETGDFLGPSPENCRLAEKVREVRLVEQKALH